jgi:hypothetical protein
MLPRCLRPALLVFATLPWLVLAAGCETTNSARSLATNPRLPEATDAALLRPATALSFRSKASPTPATTPSKSRTKARSTSPS